MDRDLAPATWRKSTFSNSQAACVEVAELVSGDRAVRDSKDPDGAVLVVDAAAWAAFTTGIRNSGLG